MQAEIITIGDEFLIGQVINTNSAWMAEHLNLNGVNVKQITSVADNEEDIILALSAAVSRVDIVLITGGLGPTKDDITKASLCKYFNTPLIFNNDVYLDVEAIFKKYGKEVTAINRKQAEVPESCKPIRNKNGTAPGMYFELNEKLFFSLPGVPYEMKAMFENDVLPMIKNRFTLPSIYHKTILTQGIGESFLSEIITTWEEKLRESKLKLAYLPSPGKVRLRISAYGKEKGELIKLVEQQIENVKPLIKEYLYGYEVYGEPQVDVAETIGKLLRTKQATLVTAESCTGGYIAHLITSVSGASDYYRGSIIAYANEVKETQLHVDSLSIEKFGVVSKQVVEQMAIGARKKLNADFAISTSGIAGPTGGSAEKPVGTVWIAVAHPVGVLSEKFLFGDNRKRTIEKTTNAALNMLLKQLLK